VAVREQCGGVHQQHLLALFYRLHTGRTQALGDIVRQIV
jgi:hypothetical protein